MEEWTAFKTMLRYAILPILLAVAVMAVEAFSVAIQAAPSTKIEAIKDCRAELGEHAKYLKVRACVLRKMKRE
ncbi:MAG: hypothetical protein ACLPTZ_03605 [Beijerinckiaceae bacterium]